MANEASVTVSLSYTSGNVSVSESVGPLLRDVAGTNSPIETVQVIGTSEEAIQLLDAGSGGLMFLRNLDATNYVSIRRATGEGNLIKLLPGDVALFRLEATAPFAIANTAACKLKVVLLPL